MNQIKPQDINLTLFLMKFQIQLLKNLETENENLIFYQGAHTSQFNNDVDQIKKKSLTIRK